LKNVDFHHFAEICVIFSGGEESRTPVQTYSSKAFYMFIWLLFVGRKQEISKPINSLAAWS